MPPDLGTPEHATSPPDQSAQPAMATAVVDGLPAMCHVDPVLDQVAGLGLDDGLVHGGVPFPLRSVGARHLVGALSRLQRTPPRGVDTGGTIFRGDFRACRCISGTVQEARSPRPVAGTRRDRNRRHSPVCRRGWNTAQPMSSRADAIIGTCRWNQGAVPSVRRMWTRSNLASGCSQHRVSCSCAWPAAAARSQMAPRTHTEFRTRTGPRARPALGRT